jgi:hypothetical protein
VEIRDDLPKSNVGKILRKDLRAEDAAGGGVVITWSEPSNRRFWRHDLRHHAGHGRVADPARLLAGAARPYGLMIGVVSQYGFMPFIGFLMITGFGLPEPIAVGC